ncbi:MAG: ATP-dependent Clp protease adaptor ClpS [Planctomycetales bacterium]|nr:ATP-dependent Clp protease adaptor ClpS [Planctomycetales bacterium]
MDTLVATSTKPRKKRRSQSQRQVRRQPRYHVLLWNDDDHTYDYVIDMLRSLFGYAAEKGFQLAEEVDHRGKAIVLTTTREHAELKRDQIHAYGQDPRGSMSASIEPER